MKLIKPSLGNNELVLIKEVFESDILTNDVKVKDFEDKVRDFTGIKYAVATSTGTAALHLSLLASGISEGNEVIVPAMAFPATINALLYVRAVPVLVDININTLNIEIREIEAKITPTTKAILVVDLFGLPVDIVKIREITDKYNLKVIEDASYAFGSKINGNYCGSGADVAVYSFNERRVITSGEGGMVVTNDYKVADKAKLLRNHAMQKSGKDQEATFTGVGYNYRMSEIHAAIGVSQMFKIDELLDKRRRLAKEYTRVIENIQNVTPAREPIGAEQNYANYVIKLDVNKDPVALRAKLRERHIPTTIGTYCLHKQSVYGFDGDYPVAEYAYRYGISLPINSFMKKDDVLYVCEMLERFLL